MKNNRPNNWKRIFLITVCVLLFILLLCLIAAVIYMENLLSLINKKDPNAPQSTLSSSQIDDILNQTDPHDPDFSGPSMDGEDVTWGSEPTDPVVADDNIINFLLIGQDRRPGESRARSDAMILCTINKSAKTVTLSSFMRDMYVQIPGYRDNRINASYAIGGMKLLDACIEKNFGILVDGNVEVDFTGFKKVIDILGGVEIELTRSEANYLNERGNWDIEDNAGTWSLKSGINKLNGSQAVAYSRIRYVGNGDFGRTNRQRVVLSALVDKAKTLSLPQLNTLLKSVLPLLTTDLSDAEILNYAAQLFPLLTEFTINTQQIPAEGAYKMTMIDGMSVLLPNLEKNRQILEDIIKE